MGKLFLKLPFVETKQVFTACLVCSDHKMTDFRIWKIAGKVRKRVRTLGFRTVEFGLFG